MKFGKVEDPELINFSLPDDHPDTHRVLSQSNAKASKIHIGCAKWGKSELKNFYPRGTKDELSYYSEQFNCIELNATFYRMFRPEQFATWYEKTPDDFKFFPKVPQRISQFKRLKNAEDEVEYFLESVSELHEKLGMIFLQMHPNFKPAKFDDLGTFLQNWPQGFPLAVELRHKDWYEDESVNDQLASLLEEFDITHVITDTAGRRDLVHMRLSTPKTFIRYNGANHPTDYSRLDDWTKRIAVWINRGAKELNFFVHQNHEQASPWLSAYLIRNINRTLGTSLRQPEIENADEQRF